MTMGPDPIRRMVDKSVRLGIYHFPKSLLESDTGRPPRGSLEFGRVADKIVNVTRSHQSRIRYWLHVGANETSQSNEDVPESHAFPSRNIVCLAGNSVLEQTHIGAYYVPDVENVSHWLQVAGGHTVGTCSRGGPQSLKKGGNDIQQRLTRPGMRKSPGDDDSKRHSPPGLERRDLRSDLAGSIGRLRARRVALDPWPRWSVAVNLSTGDKQYDRVPRARSFQGSS